MVGGQSGAGRRAVRGSAAGSPGARWRAVRAGRRAIRGRPPVVRRWPVSGPGLGTGRSRVASERSGAGQRAIRGWPAGHPALAGGRSGPGRRMVRRWPASGPGLGTGGPGLPAPSRAGSGRSGAGRRSSRATVVQGLFRRSARQPGERV